MVQIKYLGSLKTPLLFDSDTHGYLKWPGNSGNFQFSGIVLSPDRSLSSFGTKISRLEEYILTYTGRVTKSKGFVSVSLKTK